MEELMTGKGEPSGGGGIGGGGGAPEPPSEEAEWGRGGPGGEGGGTPWGREFGEELSGLRESSGGVYTGTERHTRTGERKKTI